jgi:cytosine/uracil/thiamine/allantoin permease
MLTLTRLADSVNGGLAADLGLLGLPLLAFLGVLALGAAARLLGQAIAAVVQLVKAALTAAGVAIILLAAVFAVGYVLMNQ